MVGFGAGVPATKVPSFVRGVTANRSSAREGLRTINRVVRGVFAGPYRCSKELLYSIHLVSAFVLTFDYNNYNPDYAGKQSDSPSLTAY